jgi:DNA-binding PadR family transcriptional regulator
MVGRQNKPGRRSGHNSVLTTADLVVLSLLAERAMHGYDLMAEYQRQEVADWASVSKAQLYYALNKLAELDLIQGHTESAQARERTVYAVTETGQKALVGGLADPAWARGRTAQPFTTWLGLSIHAAPDTFRNLLEARADWLAAEITKEQESLAFIETLSSARADRGADIVRLVIRQLEVEKDWVTDLMKS